MAHPYAKYAADKVGREKAKSYQSGGKVPEPERLGRNAGRERRENYARGMQLLDQGMFGASIHPNSLHQQMRVFTGMDNARRVSDAVPRGPKKED